jgi:hypothetical protein
VSSTTAISEERAVVRARAFVRAAGVDAVPVSIEKYLAQVSAEVRTSGNLARGEAGNTMFVRGRHLITVNSNDRPERQRFTILHEVAHIALNLPSNHGNTVTDESLYSYVRRPIEEVICDAFAAECLLPHEILRRDLVGEAPTFDLVESIARRYQASLTCTASRVATNSPEPCAYVLSESGFIRFVAYSQSMRELGFWVTPRIAIPAQSVTGRCWAANIRRDSDSVPAYVWSARDQVVNMDLFEDAFLAPEWNQALTLLLMDDAQGIDQGSNRTATRDEDVLLEELDGQLPWPSGKKRR